MYIDTFYDFCLCCSGFVPSQAGPVEADVLKFYLNTSTNSITGRDSFLSEAQGYRCGFADGLCADTVLYCTVLYCTVLYCTVLYCTVLYCTVLSSPLLVPSSSWRRWLWRGRRLRMGRRPRWTGPRRSGRAWPRLTRPQHSLQTPGTCCSVLLSSIRVTKGSKINRFSKF